MNPVSLHKSGSILNPTTVEIAYPDEKLATFFKRDTEHNGMLQKISPQDWRLQAIVEICQKVK